MFHPLPEIIQFLFNVIKQQGQNAYKYQIEYTGVFYLVFVGILTLLFNYIEKKLDYFR